MSSNAFDIADGKIVLGQSRESVMDLVGTMPTPFYFYNADHVVARAQFMLKTYREAGLPISVHYATKANTNPLLLKKLASFGIKADVVSSGEAAVSMGAGFQAQDILFSGVAKTKSEIEFAIQKGIGQINVESLGELQRISEIAEAISKGPGGGRRLIDIGLRLNPNVCPETHPYITTGLQENKFGLEESGIREAVRMLKTMPLLRLRGLSLHIGSQLLDLVALDEAIEIGARLQRELRQETGWLLDRFDVGGGLGIRYETNDESLEFEVVQRHAELLKKHLGVDIQNRLLLEVLTEPGRWLIARCGLLVTEVQYVKETPHKTFVIVDGGMNLLIRPALYEAQHRIEPLARRHGPRADGLIVKRLMDVVGPICESADFLGRDRDLARVEQGDRLAVFDAGAYGRTMASLYNQRGWPDEYVYGSGKVEKANVSN
ncbi:MAG: diaminopimelate decarboxylase [Deltaproteobacteria bacterium]|nr:diaminopimelate decarboxylase [Deltaproteobacteria bacterium]